VVLLPAPGSLNGAIGLMPMKVREVIRLLDEARMVGDAITRKPSALQTSRRSVRDHGAR
jgi:hypothetical protein